MACARASSLALKRGIHRLHAGVEQRRGFLRRPAEHLAQDQDGALLWRKVL
jgi:hypothetical protein